MSLRIPSVCTDPCSYTDLGRRNQLAVTTLRGLPKTTRVVLTQDGIPIVPRQENWQEKQRAVDSYSLNLFELNEPLEELMQADNRAAFNDEIVRFSYGSYGGEDSDESNGKTETQEDKRFWSSLKSLGFFDEEEVENKQAEIGTMMDWSEEAVKARDPAWQYMSEKRRHMNHWSNIQNNLPQFALLGLLNADTGYASSVLLSEDMGLRHPNDNVRLGTVNILSGLERAVPFKIEADLKEQDRIAQLMIGPKKEEFRREAKIFVFQDALSTLHTIFESLRLVQKDRNNTVRERVQSVEDSLIRHCEQISCVIKELSS